MGESPFLRLLILVPNVFRRRLGSNVEKIGKYVVKVGRVEEAYSSKYASSLGIPVPSVVGIVRRGDTTYIITKYVEGNTLRDQWRNMNDVQKSNIISELKEYMGIMRRKKHERICSTNGRGMTDNMIHTKVFGPFESQKDFNEMLLRGIEDKVYLPALDMDRDICFTHGDLAPHNIIVRNNRIVSIVDWEYSGYFPEYWEYVKMGYPRFKREKWQDFFSEYFHNYEGESRAIEKILELKPSF